MHRRDFLVCSSLAVAMNASGGKFGWAREMGKSIVDYGARADGRNLNTSAIQRAIDDVSRNGGGVVQVPAGTFLTGRIDLRSHVTLQLDEGATLLGSTSLSDYEGGDDRNQRHLIYAKNAEEVALSGPGRIDGQGASFWEPSGKTPLPPDHAWADGVSRLLKAKDSGRPSPMVLFANCRGVSVDGVRLENSAGWTLHLLNCDDVRITGITIANPVNGPNTDGIDVTCSQNVTITGCSIATGDDAICLKSQSSPGTEPRLVKNVTVNNCTLSTSCNGFKIGTETQGGFENIVFSNSVIRSGPVPLTERVISGVALEIVDGGWVDGVQVSGIQMQRTRTPLFLRLGNRKRVYDYPQHGLRRVVIRDIQASEAVLASSITGISGDLVEDITLSNLRFENVLEVKGGMGGFSVPEKENAYPEARMFGMLPATGLYVRHARNLHFDHLEFSATRDESRPALMFDDAEGVHVSNLRTTPVRGGMPVVSLENARNVTIAESAPPAGTDTFLSVSGDNSANVVLAGDDLRAARHAFKVENGASPQAVTIADNAQANH